MEKKLEKKTQEELDLDIFLEELEGQEEEKVKITKLGNSLVRFSLNENFIEAKVTMSYGDKLKVKSATKPRSIVFDDETMEREIMLNQDDTDLLILTKQIINSNLGELNIEAIQKNETHEKLFEAVLEVVKNKNGLTMTKKQLEKMGKKKNC